MKDTMSHWLRSRKKLKKGEQNESTIAMERRRTQRRV